MEDLIDHGKDLGFYFKRDGKPLKIFNTLNIAWKIE